MKMKSLGIGACALLWTAPAAARTVRVEGGGSVQNLFVSNGGQTGLAGGSALNISFSFDPDSLVLVGSDASAAGYRFTVSNLSASIGDYQFAPAGVFGVVTFARAFAFFGGSSSESVLLQSFAFSGTAAGAPFTLPNGLSRTNLALTSTFRYGNDLPPIDPRALTDPALAARSSFSFGAVPISGAARASVFGPAGASFATSPVPEPSAWALLILGFGATGVAMRRRSARVARRAA